MFWCLFLYLIWTVSVQADTNLEVKSPFREGIEYRYEWEASIESESAVNNQQTTSTWLRGQLYIISKAEDVKWRSMLRIKNVSLAIQHGEKGSKITPPASAFVESTELNDQLGKPFHLLYIGSKVEAAAFPDDKEHLWSTNFKRSILSLLQVELRSSSEGNPTRRGNHIYTNQELSLYGKCSVNYYSSSVGENQYLLQKNIDLNSCPESLGRWRTFIDIPSCPGQEEQTIAGSTNTANYVIVPNRGHPEMVKVESSSAVWIDPFGISTSLMKNSAKIKMHLEKTRRSTEQIPSITPFNDRLRYVFQSNKEAIIDLKAAQNLMLHSEPLIYGQENLRRKTQLDLLNTVESLSAESYTSEQRISMDQLPLSSISYQLGSLDYSNARALYKELSVSIKNEKLNSARNLFLDLILHSGSNVGIILLRDLIREQQLDSFTAARLVAYAGAYVKEPTEKLLLEFQTITDSKLPTDGDYLKVFSNAATLAIASLIGKTCSGSSTCRSIRIEEWRQKYFNNVKTSASFAEKALNIHALHNIGYGSTLDAILEMVARKPETDDDNTNDLRIYLARGLTSHKKQTKVLNALLGVLRDVQDIFRMRIATAQVLLDGDVNMEVFEHIHQMLFLENNSQVRQYLISAIRVIATSKNPCNRNLKEKAQQLLNRFGNEDTSKSGNSAEYAFDFLDSSSLFGSQLNLRTTSSEFDDLPGFVAGKLMYFIKGVAVQPFSFTVRMSGMRKYINNIFSSTLQKEDLVMSRIHDTMDEFNFAPRKELEMSLDIAFKLHGTVVMFYHFDKNFFGSALGTIRNVDFLQDLTFNIQRYATTGALLYTQTNGLGFPVSFIFSAPILLSVQGSISKTKQPGTFGRHLKLNIYGEIYGDHGLLSHFTPLNFTQGVVRNRKAICNVPLEMEIVADPKKMQLDITGVNPKTTNAIEISSFARTILTYRPSESSYERMRSGKFCQQCQPVVLVSRKGSLLKTETIANLTWPISGTEAHAQVFNCDGNRSVGKQIQLVLGALSPLSMNFRGNPAAWAYLSFIQLQHLVFVQPEGRHCGFRGKVFRSAMFPVKEVFCRLKLKSNFSEEAELSWQSGKLALKAEINWKGETIASDRKGELDITYEYRNAGARNTVNVRALIVRSPLLNINRDFMLCLKAESTFQPTPLDIIDISGYQQPPTAQGSIEYVMGNVPSFSQCPTDQFRFKMGIKASAGSWVIQRRNEANSWPYKDCDQEKKSQNWAPGIIPQTEECYRAALDFTTLSNYNFDFKFAAVPYQLEKLMGKFGDLISLSLLPYWKAEPAGISESVGASKEVGHVQVNVTFLPDISDDGFQLVNLHWGTNNVIERYTAVTLPFGSLPLPSTSIPQATRIAYDSDVIPSCLVTSQYIRTLDKVKFNNTFSPCYTLVTSDCGSNPLFGVFVRRTAGLYPLATKVQVGGHTIEIIPDESGRRKQFTVRANDLDIDVQNNSYTLPEGREKFFVLKVRYQAPIYIISSPGAGLLVHYSGSHVAVFPTWFHKNQHCGLCGNFDGETDREWISPQGCPVNNATVLLASYTLGQTCYPNEERMACPDGASQSV